MTVTLSVTHDSRFHTKKQLSVKTVGLRRCCSSVEQCDGLTTATVVVGVITVVISTTLVFLVAILIAVVVAAVPSLVTLVVLVVA